MTDDEKFLWKNMKVEEAKKMAVENMKVRDREGRWERQWND